MKRKIEHEIFPLGNRELPLPTEVLHSYNVLKNIYNSRYQPDQIEDIKSKWLYFKSKISNSFSERIGYTKSTVITTNKYLKTFYVYKYNPNYHASKYKNEYMTDLIGNLEKEYFEDFIQNWRNWQSVLINSIDEFGDIYRPGKRDNSQRLKLIYTDIVNQSFKKFYNCCPDTYKKNESDLLNIRLIALKENKYV